MFRDISIMGRVIYIIYSMELYLKEKENIEKWSTLLNALWSFPNYENGIVDYADKIIECMPETILDEREDFKTFEHFEEEELNELKSLYVKTKSTEIIDYLMQQIDEIFAYNLYTTIKEPEEYSLKIMNNTYRYIQKLLGEKTPDIDRFRAYSIHENQCWGNYSMGREELYVEIKKH